MALDDAAKKKARNRGFTILLVEDDPPFVRRIEKYSRDTEL